MCDSYPPCWLQQSGCSITKWYFIQMEWLGRKPSSLFVDERHGRATWFISILLVGNWCVHSKCDKQNQSSGSATRQATSFQKKYHSREVRRTFKCGLSNFVIPRYIKVPLTYFGDIYLFIYYNWLRHVTGTTIFKRPDNPPTLDNTSGTFRGPSIVIYSYNTPNEMH